MNLMLPSILVACLATAVAAAEPAKVPDLSPAPEKATVFAVAKVGGRTKTIDKHLYHLVAIRLTPLMENTGSRNSVLTLGGHLSQWSVEGADPERALEDAIRRYELRWMRLPDEGSLEVVWGSLTYPVEKEGVLRDRLVKSGYVPFRVDLRKLPVVVAGSAKELLAALDELAKRRIVKPDPEGGITAEVKGRLVHGSVRGEVRKSWSVTVKGESIPFGAVAVGEPIVLDTNDGSMDDRCAALEGKLVVVRGRLRFGHELGNVGNATTFYPSGRSTPAVVRVGLAVESIESTEPAPPKAMLAPEKATVFAVAKVGGRTKTIDGQVYHLVAISLNPSIWVFSTGATSPVLTLGGHLGQWAVEEADPERALESRSKGCELRWMRLPDEGSLEVVWGALTYANEKERVLRDRLVKAGYVPFSVDVRKLPVVKAGSAKELLAALDELAKRPVSKPDRDGTIKTTTEVEGRLVYGTVSGFPRKTHSVTVGTGKMTVVLEGRDEAVAKRLAALEGKLVVARGHLKYNPERGKGFDPTQYFRSRPAEPVFLGNEVAVESVEEAK